MRNLIITPNMASLNLGQYAEEAVIVEESPKNVKHFIEANTEEATLNHLQHECITPVFSKDNELTINHAAFIETIQKQQVLSLMVKLLIHQRYGYLTLSKAEYQKQYANLPISYWNLIKPFTMRELLSALIYQLSMKQLVAIS